MVSCREGAFDRVVGYHAEGGSYTSRAEDHEERDQASRKVDQVSREEDSEYRRERKSCSVRDGSCRNELQVLFSRRRVSWRLRKGIMQMEQGVSCTREKRTIDRGRGGIICSIRGDL
jgi:hypothetical protein